MGAAQCVHVQDATQQYGPSLLRQLPAGSQVLDACAAPGGKLRALLRYQPRVRVLALDKGATRASGMRATLAAGGLTQVGGGRHTIAWGVHGTCTARASLLTCESSLNTQHAWFTQVGVLCPDGLPPY